MLMETFSFFPKLMIASAIITLEIASVEFLQLFVNQMIFVESVFKESLLQGIFVKNES